MAKTIPICNYICNFVCFNPKPCLHQLQANSLHLLLTSNFISTIKVYNVDTQKKKNYSTYQDSILENLPIEKRAKITSLDFRKLTSIKFEEITKSFNHLQEIRLKFSSNIVNELSVHSLSTVINLNPIQLLKMKNLLFKGNPEQLASVFSSAKFLETLLIHQSEIFTQNSEDLGISTLSQTSFYFHILKGLVGHQKIKKLHFPECHYIDAYLAYLEFLTSAPNLAYISIHSDLSKDQLKELSGVVNTHTQFKAIETGKKNIFDGDMLLHFFSCLNYNPNISSFDFSSLSLGLYLKEEYEKFTQFLTNLPNIEKLDSFTTYNLYPISWALERTRIKSLVLSGTKFADQNQQESLCSILLNCQCIKDLSFKDCSIGTRWSEGMVTSFITNLKENRGIEKITLDNSSSFSTNDKLLIEMISEGMKFNFTIKKLEISTERISLSSMQILFHSLKSNHSLTDLSVDFFNPMDLATEDSLLDMLSEHSQLKNISIFNRKWISKNPLFMQYLVKNRKRIAISAKDFSQECISTMVDEIAKNEKLKSLSIEKYERNSNDGIFQLFAQLFTKPTSLQRFSLKNNIFSDLQQIALFFSNLKFQKNLYEVKLFLIWKSEEQQQIEKLMRDHCKCYNDLKIIFY